MYSKLESLRGVAACLVVLIHISYLFPDAPIRFISNAYLFVDFFFMISGFVMSYAYTDKIKNGLSINTFIFLRLGRIYPLHVFMLFVFVFYAAAKTYLHSIGFGGEQEFEQNNFWSFFSNLFLIHSLGVHDYLTWNQPSWSISVEFFTYMVFFMLVKSLDKNTGMVIPVIVSIICYCALLGLKKSSLDITYDLGLIRCVAAFYLGVFLFRAKPLLDKFKYNANLAEIGAFVFVIFSISVAHKGWSYQFLSLASLFIALLVYSNHENGFLGWILQSTPMRAIGIWSYSIYMIHSFVISVASSFLRYVAKIDLTTISEQNIVIINIIILVIVVSISRFSYIYIEDKYRKLAKSIINK